jgi:ABC-type Na+ transport system ATPase subunit NatA
MILGMSVGAFTILHVIITLVAIGSGLIVVGGMFASHRLPSYNRTVSFHHGTH